ncbi:N-acetyltransferase esco2 [Rhizophlyctis rosea]|nr:N-acetyltransferase esco2 [Rhizophlyctis rosea]
MEYALGKGEDEAVHDRYHRAMISGVEWSRHVNEVVLQTFHDGAKIILAGEGSNARERKKIRDIISIVDQELSAIPLTDAEIDRSKIYLYLSNTSKVYGCVIAESISHAYRALALGEESGGEGGAAIDGEGGTASIGGGGALIYCSTVRVPALCGISRIWVSKLQRRKGIGRKMLDVVRSRFLFGCTIETNLLAFSQPTPSGKCLAERYCGRPDFLVYDLANLDGDGETCTPSALHVSR